MCVNRAAFDLIDQIHYFAIHMRLSSRRIHRIQCDFGIEIVEKNASVSRVGCSTTDNQYTIRCNSGTMVGMSSSSPSSQQRRVHSDVRCVLGRRAELWVWTTLITDSLLAHWPTQAQANTHNSQL